jgi:3-oxoacyl-[acyl-carrier protein] reductase
MTSAETQTPGPLPERVALITGAPGDLSLALARRLAASGTHVGLIGPDWNRTQNAVASLQAGPGSITGFAADSLDPAGLEAFMTRIEQTLGGVDILVHIPEFREECPTPATSLRNLSDREFNMAIDSTLTGTFLWNRAVIGPMTRRRGGRLINVVQTAPDWTTPFGAVCNATIQGIVGFSEALADEVQKSNIRVTTVWPEALQDPEVDRHPSTATATAADPDSLAAVIEALLALPDPIVLRQVLVTPFHGGRRRKGRAGREGSPA